MIPSVRSLLVPTFALSIAISSPAQTISDKQWWDQRSSVEEYKSTVADVSAQAAFVQYIASKLNDLWTDRNFDSALSEREREFVRELKDLPSNVGILISFDGHSVREEGIDINAAEAYRLSHPGGEGAEPVVAMKWGVLVGDHMVYQNEVTPEAVMAAARRPSTQVYKGEMCLVSDAQRGDGSVIQQALSPAEIFAAREKVWREALAPLPHEIKAPGQKTPNSPGVGPGYDPNDPKNGPVGGQGGPPPNISTSCTASGCVATVHPNYARSGLQSDSLPPQASAKNEGDNQGSEKPPKDRGIGQANQNFDWGASDARVWADFNSDGFVDFCRLIDNKVLVCTLSTGPRKEDRYTGQDVSVQVADLGYPGTGAWVDINNDNSVDYCRIVGAQGSLSISCRLSEKTKFADNDVGWPMVSSDIGFAEGGRAWVDVEGKGFPSYCRIVGDGFARCEVNDGGKFGTKEIMSDIIPGSAKNPTAKWADFNGDGKADLCLIDNVNSGNNLAKKAHIIECVFSEGNKFSKVYRDLIESP